MSDVYIDRDVPGPGARVPGAQSRRWLKSGQHNSNNNTHLVIITIKTPFSHNVHVRIAIGQTPFPSIFSEHRRFSSSPLLTITAVPTTTPKQVTETHPAPLSPLSPLSPFRERKKLTALGLKHPNRKRRGRTAPPARACVRACVRLSRKSCRILFLCYLRLETLHAFGISMGCPPSTSGFEGRSDA